MTAVSRGRRADADRIKIQGVDDALLQDVARRTEGFSGRELAKLMASAQAAAYGSVDGVLTAEMFTRVCWVVVSCSTVWHRVHGRWWIPSCASTSSGVHLSRGCIPAGSKAQASQKSVSTLLPATTAATEKFAGA